MNLLRKYRHWQQYVVAEVAYKIYGIKWRTKISPNVFFSNEENHFFSFFHFPILLNWSCHHQRLMKSHFSLLLLFSYLLLLLPFFFCFHRIIDFSLLFLFLFPFLCFLFIISYFLYSDSVYVYFVEYIYYFSCRQKASKTVGWKRK